MLWIWIFSLGLRLEHRYHFPNFFPDVQLYFLLAQSWLSGNGIRVPAALPEAETTIGLLPQPSVLPGITWLSAGLRLLGLEWEQIAWSIDAFSLMLLTLFAFLSLRRLLPPSSQRAGLLWGALWWGVCVAPVHYLAVADLFSLAWFSALAYASWRLVGDCARGRAGTCFCAPCLLAFAVAAILVAGDLGASTWVAALSADRFIGRRSVPHQPASAGILASNPR